MTEATEAAVGVAMGGEMSARAGPIGAAGLAGGVVALTIRPALEEDGEGSSQNCRSRD